jgi:glycosyltransferase involved in cell wall biosynthesis
MKQVILINDILTGCMGEKVLWNYLLEGVPNIYGIELNKTKNINKFIEDNFSKNAIILQNATFIPKIDNTRTTVAFLQDNLRNFKVIKDSGVIQQQTLKSSDYIVFNSKEISNSYKEFTGPIIPIGIDSDLFGIKDKQQLRAKYGKPNKKTGIFVGNFSPVKGWENVSSIINKYNGINFILVSKDIESYNKTNTFCYNRVDQTTLSELLNCADFFILGSPVETQCLAALEAGFCGLPVIMKKTGIFMDWDDRHLMGKFNNNLEDSLLSLNISSYDTRTYLLNKDLSIKSMINKWINFLRSIPT